MVIKRLFSSLLSSRKMGHTQTRQEGRYSLVDVCKIRKHLCQKLPPELAAIILEDAEVWIRQATKRDDSCVVVAPWGQHSYSFYYLAADPIPVIRIHGEIIKTKVRRVRFTLLSHDQGWSSFPDDIGTYNGSGSWFEAGIIKPNSEPIDLPELPQTTDVFERIAFGPNGIEVPNPAGPFPRSFVQTFPGERVGNFYRWFLQANVHAKSTGPTKHVVEWTYDDDDFPNAVTKCPGTGHGRGFLNALCPGHRICIVARAETPGWSNHIYKAKVETFLMF